MTEQLKAFGQAAGHVLLGLLITVSALFSAPINTPKISPSPTNPPLKTATATATVTAASTTTPLIQIPSISSLPSAIPPSIPLSATHSSAANLPNTPTASVITIASPIVNILCLSGQNSPLQSITGSGVIIDPRGVVLTTAHIGQYFLFQNSAANSDATAGMTNCTIRTGSPASGSNTATLLYISPQWVAQNPLSITGQDSSGTGEYDFALLFLSEGNASELAPINVAYVPLATDAEEQNLSVGESAYVEGYPAEFLTGNAFENQLYSFSANTVINGLNNFPDTQKGAAVADTRSADLISLAGNIVAQKGSSGGAVEDPAGDLIGIISTVTSQSLVNQRTINAISEAHIDRSMIAQTGSDLSSFISGDIYDKSQQFNQLVAPQLTATLLNSLDMSSLDQQ